MNDTTPSFVSSLSYVGEALDLFSYAVRCKRYWATAIASYIGTHVLEVGAGTGTNTLLLASESQQHWVCLEPDSALAARLQSRMISLPSRPGILEVIPGSLRSLDATVTFDTILYIDVLEHIEHDNEEMELAYQHLVPGGHLIVLSPAHQFLYSPFDQSIGHFRRYSRKTLCMAGPRQQSPVKLFYLDSCGFAASLVNRLMLRQQLPLLSQIQFWDKYLVSASRFVDPLLRFNFGKTVIGIWKK